MAECSRLAGCPFFNLDESDPDVASVKRGLMLLYCKGDKVDNCVRLAVLHEFGIDFVPKNMMPNGMPLPRTDESEWDATVVKFKRHLFLTPKVVTPE